VPSAQSEQLSLGPGGDPGAGWPEPNAEARWTPSVALTGLLVGAVGVVLTLSITAAIFAAFGARNLDDSSGFAFAATLGQDLALVAAALIVTGGIGPGTARKFGFRKFAPSALGWMVVALLVYYSLSLVYEVIVNPPSDQLPQQFGADRSTALAVATGIFVIGVAPVIEEFFFRGFVFQALRTRLGVLGGALVSGLIFGAVHFKPEFLVPLAILGTALALLFNKTGSLWPCILAHAINNAIAFQYVMTH
jgi:membrane protease YdiL (CAAX protease family)